MSVSMQVMYPVSDGSTFDHAYYSSTHTALVDEHLGPHIASSVVTKGVAGAGPDAPAPFHAVATFVFDDQAALGAALQAAGPVLADLKNFTNVQPAMLIGEVIG